MVLPKITGLLFNCSMNCALPTLLDNIDQLAELEKKDQLPSPDDIVYKNYTRFKEGFIRYYGINNPGLFSWQQFNSILLTHSFYANEIMFLPIFRNFISENAPNHGYQNQDLWRLRDIQPEYVDSEEYVDSVEYSFGKKGPNPAAGKYNQLAASDAVELFYNYFGLVGSLELFVFNSEQKEYNPFPITIATTNTILASPAWARNPQQRIQLYLKDGHFELQPHECLQNATNDFLDEINALPERLQEIHDELSGSSSAHESNLGLSHLFRYVHSILMNSLSQQIASEHVMTCSAYRQLAKEFLFHNDTRKGRQTFAMILLAIAAEDPALKSTANRLMNKESLSDEEVESIINDNIQSLDINQLITLERETNASLAPIYRAISFDDYDALLAELSKPSFDINQAPTTGVNLPEKCTLRAGYTPMAYAIELGKVSLVELFLLMGANPYGGYGARNPIHLIDSEKGDPAINDRIQQLLVQYQSLQQSIENPQYVNNAEIDLNDLFIDAIKCGKHAEVERMLTQGFIYTDQRCHDLFSTALALAVESQSFETVALLVQRGAAISDYKVRLSLENHAQEACCQRIKNLFELEKLKQVTIMNLFCRTKGDLDACRTAIDGIKREYEEKVLALKEGQTISIEWSAALVQSFPAICEASLTQDERPMSSAFLLKCMGMGLAAGLLMTAAAVLIFMHIIIPPIAPMVIGAVLMVSGVASSGFFAYKLMKGDGSVEQSTPAYQ